MTYGKVLLLFTLFALIISSTCYARDLTDVKTKAKSSIKSITSYLNPRKLKLRSSSAMVMDQGNGRILFRRGVDKPRPIASITKLMTAMVVLDADLEMGRKITITKADKDRKRYSRSRLRFGTALTRSELLQLALMASENRAASALARTYPGGSKAFVRAMNRKARSIGMMRSRFADPTGLDSRNMATAVDLAKMVKAAYGYDSIRKYTTKPWSLLFTKRKIMKFNNTNRLVRKDNWDIGLSKTGFISDAGYCLVMQANISDRPVLIILLNSWGKLSKFGDANRIKKWLQGAEKRMLHDKLKTASTS